MRLTKSDYEKVHAFAFSEHNPGYTPEVIESPNGDTNWDTTKKYAHIAPKYFKQMKAPSISKFLGTGPDSINSIYEGARKKAISICQALDIPKEFWGGDDSTLRILDYPPGATTAPHTDFNLFTVCLYRDDTASFKYLSGSTNPLLNRARDISEGIHFGEIMTEINGCEATKHEVVATKNRQCSIVFFVVPNHESILPSGISVGDWLEERKNRSRKINY